MARGGPKLGFITMKGFDKHIAYLERLPVRMRTEVEDRAGSEIATLTVKEIKGRLKENTRSGRLYRGIRSVRIHRGGAGKGDRIFYQIIAGTRAGDKSAESHGWVWRFLEYGVAPHMQGRGEKREGLVQVTRVIQRGKKAGQVRQFTRRQMLRPKTWEHPGFGPKKFLVQSLRTVLKRAPEIYNRHIEAVIRELP